MYDELNTLMKNGDINTDYSDIANAVGEIVDNRADEYIFLLSTFLQKDESTTRCVASDLVKIMYQRKDSEQRDKMIGRFEKSAKQTEVDIDKVMDSVRGFEELLMCQEQEPYIAH